MQNNNSSEIIVLNKDLESYIFNSAKYYALKLVKNGFYSFYEVNDLKQETRSRYDTSFACNRKLVVRRSVKERSENKFLFFFIIELKSITMMNPNHQ